MFYAEKQTKCAEQRINRCWWNIYNLNSECVYRCRICSAPCGGRNDLVADFITSQAMPCVCKTQHNILYMRHILFMIEIRNFDLHLLAALIPICSRGPGKFLYYKILSVNMQTDTSCVLLRAIGWSLIFVNDRRQ